MSLVLGDKFSANERSLGTSMSILSETDLFSLGVSRLCFVREKRLKDFQESNIVRHDSVKPSLTIWSIMSKTLSSLSINKPLNNFCIDTANLCFIISDMEVLLRKILKVTGKNAIICFKSSLLIKSMASQIRLDIAFKTKDKRSIDDSFLFKYFQVVIKVETSVDTT